MCVYERETEKREKRVLHKLVTPDRLPAVDWLSWRKVSVGTAVGVFFQLLKHSYIGMLFFLLTGDEVAVKFKFGTVSTPLANDFSEDHYSTGFTGVKLST